MLSKKYYLKIEKIYLSGTKRTISTYVDRNHESTFEDAKKDALAWLENVCVSNRFRKTKVKELIVYVLDKKTDKVLFKRKVNVEKHFNMIMRKIRRLQEKQERRRNKI